MESNFLQRFFARLNRPIRIGPFVLLPEKVRNGLFIGFLVLAAVAIVAAGFLSKLIPMIISIGVTARILYLALRRIERSQWFRSRFPVGKRLQPSVTYHMGWIVFGFVTAVLVAPEIARLLATDWTQFLVCLLAASAVLTLILRARYWRLGTSARVSFFDGFLALPIRYLIDVHDVVARDRYAARMHIPTAAGFVAVSALLVVIYLVGFDAIALRYATALAATAVIVGAALVFCRRVRRPARLSRGVFTWLPINLAGFAVLSSYVALHPSSFPYPDMSWHLALVILVWIIFVSGLNSAFGPMRHAFAGALHLAFHPRPARFGGAKRDVGLAPLDLDAPKLGVETPRDFPWNRLLGFDACVQCGRCEVACPAFAAGQPLNPKKLIQDFVLGMAWEDNTDKRYSGSPHPGRPIGQARGGIDQPIIGDLVHPDTLWACTTCRSCVHECPMMIEHVDAVIDLRRFQTLERGAIPVKAAAMLEDLRATDNPGGRDSRTRLDWAADLRLPILAEGGSADVLLWLGDAAFDLRGQRTLRALVGLLRRAGVGFAVLGADELDCGDAARRLGDEATFQDLAKRVIATLATRRFDRIVTADPHALNSLRNDYPALGGHYRVVHHTALLADLVTQGRLTIAKPLAEAITYHDPCYLGRYNGEIAAPRRLLAAIASDTREMARHGLRSFCCGGGGGAPLTDVPGARRIPDLRMDQARATGAATLAVACPNCAVMLEGVVAPRPRVADLAELLAEAVGA